MFLRILFALPIVVRPEAAGCCLFANGTQVLPASGNCAARDESYICTGMFDRAGNRLELRLRL
jgi:hypothetical protein